MDAVPVDDDDDNESHKNDTVDCSSSISSSTSTAGTNGVDVMELVKSTWDRCSLLNDGGDSSPNGTNNISVLQVAWEMGRRGYKSFGQLGLPDGFPWDSALLIKQTNGILVSIMPDEILLLIMGFFNFKDLLRFGMVCGRFNQLWKDEHIHKNLCNRLGIMINIVHPSLPLIYSDPWFECSIRMAAWARAIRIDENKIPYLGRPSPRDRILAKDIGGLNPLGCFMGIKANDYEIRRVFAEGEGHPVLSWQTAGTFCVFCKKNYTIGDMYYRLTEGKTCFSCFNYIRSNTEKMCKSIEVRCFDERVPCTYCRGLIKKHEQCLVKAYAVICNDCWSAKGFHLRVTMAQKLYNLNRADKKVLWLGRTMLNPCKYLYSEEEKKSMSTSISHYILGEDARAQAVITHGSLKNAMHKATGTLYRRLGQRARDIHRLRMEIYKILYLDPKAVCYEVIKKAEKDTNQNKAKLVAELLHGKVDIADLKKEVTGDFSADPVQTRHLRLMYLHKLNQEDKIIEDIIKYGDDDPQPRRRRRQNFISNSSNSSNTKQGKKRSREPLPAAAAASKKTLPIIIAKRQKRDANQ